MIEGGFHKIPDAIASLVSSEFVITVERETLVYPRAEELASARYFVTPFNRTKTGGTRQKGEYVWRSAVAALQSLPQRDSTSRKAAEDALLTTMDSIFVYLDGLDAVSVDGTKYPMQIPSVDAISPVDPSYKETKVFFQAFYVDVFDL